MRKEGSSHIVGTSAAESDGRRPAHDRPPGEIVEAANRSRAGDARLKDATRYSVRITGDWRELEELESTWKELAANALEPSPSAESWMLIPALRYGIPGSNVRVVLVFASESGVHDGQHRLCGVFPIEELQRYQGLPIRIVRFWNHMYSISSTPLLRRERAAECLGVFFEWVVNERPARTLVEFPGLRGDSEFFRLLTETLRTESFTHLVRDIHTRALFRPRGNAEEYILSVAKNHDRRRRQERRLAEKGRLTYDQFVSGQNIEKWLTEFVDLEMRGWKGSYGTAFGCNHQHEAWLRDVVRGAAERGCLMMLALRLDDKAVAMRLSFLAPPGAFAFKVAFDEKLSKFSPGVLLELENIRRLHSSNAIEWMDSLAAPGHSLIDRIWPDRTAIASLLVAPGRYLGKVLISVFPLLQLVKRSMRSTSSSDK